MTRAYAVLADLGLDCAPELQFVTGPHGAVRLSPQERAVLTVLAEQNGAPVARDRLGDGRAVDFTVRRLREKLEADPGSPRIVLTVHGVGYRIGVAAPLVRALPPRELLALSDREVDLDLGLVIRLGDEVSLTTLQREVLQALVEARGRSVSRSELCRRSWGGARNAERAVDRVVHELRQLLEARPEAPVHLQTVRGSGYRLVVALPRTNLAPNPGRSVGRQNELATLLEAGREAGWSLILGPPGVGKSHLAERACRALAETLPGGAWWVDGSTCRTAEALFRAVANVLGLNERVRDGSAVTHAVARRPAIALVLDNLEQIAGASAVAAALVRGGARVIGTSSRALDGPVLVLPLQGLTTDEGRALYLLSAPVGTEPDRATIDALVEALDGHPLAIDLAARRAAAVPPAAWLARDDRFEVLALREPAGRHGSVRTALDWAWQHTPADERRALRAVAVFRSPFSLDAAVAVAGVPLEALERLVDRSWVERLPSGEPPVFRLHGLVAEWLATSGATDHEVVERWRRWFVGRAHLLRHELADEGRPEIDRTLPDLLAVGWDLVDADPEGAAAVAKLLLASPWHPDTVRWPLFDALVDGGRSFPSQAVMWAERASRLPLQRDFRGAEAALATALALGADPKGWDAREARLRIAHEASDRSGGDPGPEAPTDTVEHYVNWLGRRGRYLDDVGRCEEGLPLLREAIALATRHGYLLDALGYRSWLATGLGLGGADDGVVAEVFEQCMLGYEAAGMPFQASLNAWYASCARANEGRREQARLLARRILAAAGGDSTIESWGRVALLRAAVDEDPAPVLSGALAYLAWCGTRQEVRADLEYGTLLAAIGYARLDQREAALALIDRLPPVPLGQAIELRTGIEAVAALLDPERAVPPLLPVRYWANSAVCLVRSRRDGSPLTDRAARLDRERNTLIRAIDRIPGPGGR